MKYQDFKAATQSKIAGTLNLYKYRNLCGQLDFVVLVSSAAGTVSWKASRNITFLLYRCYFCVHPSRSKNIPSD